MSAATDQYMPATAPPMRTDRPIIKDSSNADPRCLLVSANLLRRVKLDVEARHFSRDEPAKAS